MDKYFFCWDKEILYLKGKDQLQFVGHFKEFPLSSLEDILYSINVQECYKCKDNEHRCDIPLPP